MNTHELAEQCAAYALAIMERDRRIAKLDNALRLAVATIDRLANTEARRASVQGTRNVAYDALAYP